MDATQPLSDQQILSIWECCRHMNPLDRALMILHYSNTSYTWTTLTQLSIGARNSLLLNIHRQCFGEEFCTMCHCPSCGIDLEAIGKLQKINSEEKRQPKHYTFVLDNDSFEIGLRLMNSMDLAGICHQTYSPSIQHQNDNEKFDLDKITKIGDEQLMLLDRCILYAVKKSTGETILPHDYFQFYDEVSKAIEEHDPAMINTANIRCTKCQHKWNVNIDMGIFLWEEISSKAKLLLNEVQVLAQYYGWNESEILNMSSARRIAYMKIVNSSL